MTSSSTASKASDNTSKTSHHHRRRPAAGRPYDPLTDRIAFRYRRATNRPDVTLSPMVSPTLAGWQPADTTDLSILESGVGWEKIELSLPAPPSGRLFLKLDAQLNP